MPTSIETFKKIIFDLDTGGGVTYEYSMTNNNANTNNCYLNFNLNTPIQNQSVIITVKHYTALNGSLENTETFILNYNNKLLNKNINLTSAYTLISIDYNSFNGILSGYIEKLIVNGNSINSVNFDISGQRVLTDISGQRVDVSGQLVLSQVNNSYTTNLDNITGINIYQIRPKTIMYILSGQNATNLTNVLLSGPSSTLTIATYDYGKANPRRWYADLSGNARTLTYDYVNNNGDLITDSLSLSRGLNALVASNTIVSINKWKLSTNLGTNDILYLKPTNSSGENAGGGDFSSYYNGLFTIPNNSIGFLSNLSFYASSSTNVSLYKWDVNGVRSVIYTIFSVSGFTSTAGYEGTIGGIFYPGETIGWGGISSTNAYLYSNIVIKYVI